MSADIRTDMRTALTTAIRARDRVAIAALRSALGSIDNAEAIDVIDGPLPGEGPIAGAREGLGSTEATRRVLTNEDIKRVIGAEIAERRSAAEQYDTAGRPEPAERLRTEIEILLPYCS